MVLERNQRKGLIRKAPVGRDLQASCMRTGVACRRSCFNAKPFDRWRRHCQEPIESVEKELWRRGSSTLGKPDEVCENAFSRWPRVPMWRTVTSTIHTLSLHATWRGPALAHTSPELLSGCRMATINEGGNGHGENARHRIADGVD
jgi:hypothetical protein